jgi:hypothetical protein
MVYLGTTNNRGIKEARNGVLGQFYARVFIPVNLTLLLDLNGTVTELYGLVNGIVGTETGTERERTYGY